MAKALLSWAWRPLWGMCPVAAPWHEQLRRLWKLLAIPGSSHPVHTSVSTHRPQSDDLEMFPPLLSVKGPCRHSALAEEVGANQGSPSSTGLSFSFLSDTANCDQRLKFHPPVSHLLLRHRYFSTSFKSYLFPECLHFNKCENS